MSADALDQILAHTKGDQPDNSAYWKTITDEVARAGIRIRHAVLTNHHAAYLLMWAEAGRAAYTALVASTDATAKVAIPSTAIAAGEASLAREIAAQFYDKRDPLDQSYRDIAHNIRRGRHDDQDAVELVRFALAYTAAAPKAASEDGATGLPADVRRLILAARVVAFEDPDDEATRELVEASEAFADRVPWEDEPEDEPEAAPPTDATEAHGLGPHALPIEDEPDGYDPVWYLNADDIYLQQGKSQIFLSRKQAATLALNLPVAGETL